MKILLFIACIFFSVMHVAANPGLVTVGRVEQPPVLDGNLDDPAWKSAIQIYPFMLVNTNGAPANDQTRVFMCHDGEKLYIAFKCETRILQTLLNRVHEFEAPGRKLDAEELFSDDLAGFLIQPGTERKVYDIFVNAAGSVNDAECSGNDLWGSRNTKWNSGAVVKTGQHEGYWCAEIAIELKQLGLTVDSARKYRIQFVRVGKSAKEKSCWQPCRVGFHNLDDFAEMILSSAPQAGIMLENLPPFQSGSNMFKMNFDSPRALLAAEIELISTGQKPKKFNSKTSVKGATPTNLDFTIEHPGSFDFRWSFRNLASLQVLFRSPLYKFQVQGLPLENHLTGNNLQLTLNGNPVTGSSIVATGKNTLELKTDGTVDGFLKIGDFTFPMQPGKKNLLWNDSVTWPNRPGKGVYIMAGDHQQLLMLPKGVEGMTLTDYTLNIEVPADFAVAGASSHYKIYQLEFSGPQKVQRAGKSYRRYQVKVNQPLPYDPNLKLHQYISVVVKAPPETATTQGKFYYYATSEHANMLEVPQALDYHIIPYTKGKQPQQLIVQMWPGWLKNMDDKNLQALLAQQLVNIGVTESWNVPHSSLKSMMLVYLSTYGFDEFVQNHPESASVQCELPVCSTVLRDDADARKQLTTGLLTIYDRPVKPWYICWDFEGNVLTNELACYCPRCLDDFRQQESISEAVTKEQIAGKYLPQWTRYMNGKQAAIAGVMRDGIHRFSNGQCRLSVYTGYQSDYTNRFYGVNWALLKGKIDLAACGYGRPVKDLEATLKAIGDTPLLLGELVEPCLAHERVEPPAMKRATLMRRLADSRGGILLFEYDNLDGRSFDAIAATTAFAAEHEEFFVHRQDVSSTIKVAGSSNWILLRNPAGKRLLIVMNESERPVTVTAPVQGTVAPNDFRGWLLD